MSDHRHVRPASGLARLGTAKPIVSGAVMSLLLLLSPAYAQKDSDIPGAILGYSSGAGLYKYSFKTGKTALLLQRRAQTISDSLENLVFDVKSRTLFYVDNRHNEVRQWKKGARKPETIHKIPKSHEVDWIALGPSGEKVFFPEDGALTDRLLAYDRKTRKTSVVIADFVMLADPPAWTSESHMLVAGRYSFIAKKAVWRIFDVDVSTGKRKALPQLGGVGFTLSPKAKMLAVHTRTHFSLYTFPDLKPVRRVPERGLPEGMIPDFCFAGENHLIFSHDPLNLFPGKTYILNINTGKKRLLFKGFMQGMSYLPVEPDWVVPEGDAP